jgi:hypothetical protein
MDRFPYLQSMRLRKGKGRGDQLCAMQLLARASGDERPGRPPTDFPRCTDVFLARIIQTVNDGICLHVDHPELLCQRCTAQVMSVAPLVVNTRLHDLDQQATHSIWHRVVREDLNMHWLQSKNTFRRQVMAQFHEASSIRDASYDANLAHAWALSVRATGWNWVERAKLIIDTFYVLSGIAVEASPAAQSVSSEVIVTAKEAA